MKSKEPKERYDIINKRGRHISPDTKVTLMLGNKDNWKNLKDGGKNTNGKSKR